MGQLQSYLYTHTTGSSAPFGVPRIEDDHERRCTAQAVWLLVGENSCDNMAINFGSRWDRYWRSQSKLVIIHTALPHVALCRYLMQPA